MKGGRYRFLSPVWARADCVDLGNGRVRPVRLLNAAVTNDPNLKGMRPLSNRGEGGRLKAEGNAEGAEGRRFTTETQRHGERDGVAGIAAAAAANSRNRLLSEADGEGAGAERAEGREGFEQKATKGTKGVALKNTEPAGGEKRFRWVLGESPEGRHCPSCAAVAGQVHTMAEWEAAGVKSGAGGLYCQGEGHCRLEPTDD